MTYGYDGAGRLTSETRTGTYPFTRAYTLDGVNRISQTLGGVTTSFSYSADDELTATSGGFVNSYSYNANGEQTGRTLGGVAYSLSYDYDGQLTQITQGANTTSFSYDALGRRISRTSGGVTTQFLTDPVFGRIWLEKQGATTTATYTYGNALIRKDGEVPLFDGPGSERTVTNASQTVIGRIAYEGFGQSVGTTGSSSNPYLFAATSGYRNDGDAGLVHVGARYYDAQAGLFLTRDTYLEQKPYLYCEHDPVNRVDPTGHEGVFEWIKKNWQEVVDHAGQVYKWYGRADYARGVIDLWGNWHQSLVDAETSRQMRRMINDWKPRGDIDTGAWYDLYRKHQHDGVNNTGRTAGETAKWYYQNLFPPKAP